MKNYSLVLDSNGKQLAPTKEVKAWFLVRKKRATLVNKYPMVIKLKRTISENEVCQAPVRCGIDDGGLHVGISFVQECQTKNKVVLKGTIEQRNDVKHLMDVRRGYRNYRRQHKRYRPARFQNRNASKREGRIAPSILQKRQAVIRVIKQLRKWIKIDSYYLEDVAIDIRALTDGYQPYRWEYQKSNRLDENLRKATILRDNCKCRMCEASECALEVHHIKPKRLGGSDTIHNLITLCFRCHSFVTGREEQFMDMFYQVIKFFGNNQHLNYAQHVMVGKTWLRQELSKLDKLYLTNGGDTANKRIDWDIEKSHSNDAICITGLRPDTCDIKEWTIKPMRRRSKAKTTEVLGIKHRDLVEYTFRNGETHRGYVTALYPEQKALNFQSPTKHCKKVNAEKCRLLWKFSKIYWLDKVS